MVGFGREFLSGRGWRLPRECAQPAPRSAGRGSHRVSPAPTPKRAGPSPSRGCLAVKLSRFIAEALELARLPSVPIEMCGDERCRDLYEAFTRRHARWRLIQNNRWGVALLPIPEEFDHYFRDPKQAHLRKQVGRAIRAGFTFAKLDPVARLDEIMVINRSAEVRQGQAMHPAYFDQDTVRRYLERTAEVFGVLDAAGVLRGYFCFRICGPVACGERILGDANFVGNGIMYLLIAEVVRELTRSRQADGSPRWLYFDMFPGASPGMRQFKHWIGCEPYRVSWSWRK